jgi:hypothetical protein
LRNQDIFLDTCVILRRTFYVDESGRIKDFLEKRNKKTSTYVCMELNRTFLADAETLRTYLYEETSLCKVEERIAELDDSLNVKDRLKLLLRKITEEPANLQRAKTILETLIQNYHFILLRDVAVVPSKTECEQGQYMPGYNCRGVRSMCRVGNIVEKNIALFEAVRRNIVENLRGNQRVFRICLVLDEIIKNPEKAREDPRNCFDIGDILIALDVPDDFTLVSADRHFFLICKTLKVPFHFLDPCHY